MRPRIAEHLAAALAQLLLLALLTTNPASARGEGRSIATVPPPATSTVRVPLRLEPRHLRPSVDAALGLDDAGSARLRHDDCASAEISDPTLGTAPPYLTVSLAVTARIATPVLGACVGPGTWEGRLDVTLLPRAGEDGFGVTFEARTAELRRPDGSASLLTPPTRLLADTVILPRLETVRVDFGDALAALDRLAAPDSPEGPTLVERSHLRDIHVDASGLLASLEVTLMAAGATTHGRERPLSEAELAQWARLEDELDGFLTVIIRFLAMRSGEREVQLELLAVLLDARHNISRALAEDGSDSRDPVRELFLRSWAQIRPLIESLHATDALPGDSGVRLTAFIAAADALRAIDALGPEYGIEITRDGLRRLARVLLAGDAPAAFTPLPLTPDADLRRLLRGARPGPETGARGRGGASGWLSWLIADARAGDDPAEALRGRVPTLAALDDYLALVARLLAGQADARLADGSRLPPPQQRVLHPLVKATAWKESCWRQYTGTSDSPRVLESPVGALGMMQINARVWRGIYELDRLAEDVAYNVSAGIDILEHYLVDYALRRGEHEHPGGAENLVRATYAAYNGGPGHMSRYRRDDTAERLRAIDAEFWRQFEAVRARGRPVISSCYAVEQDD